MTVERHQFRVRPENVADLVAGYDVVVDASDNFPTRFLLTDACVLADVPLSHGAVYQFEAQATTLTGGQPCYRCLFPEAPPEGAVPDCSTAGVLGVLPATVGAIQATEVLKLLIDEGDTLDGRLLVYDASDLSTETVPLRANPGCPVCGDEPLVEQASDIVDREYTGGCALGD